MLRKVAVSLIGLVVAQRALMGVTVWSAPGGAEPLLDILVASSAEAKAEGASAAGAGSSEASAPNLQSQSAVLADTQSQCSSTESPAARQVYNAPACPPPASGEPTMSAGGGTFTCPEECGMVTIKAYDPNSYSELSWCPSPCDGCAGMMTTTTYTCVDYQVCAAAPSVARVCRNKTVVEWNCCPCSECSPCSWSTTTWGTAYPYQMPTLCIPAEGC